MSLKKRRLYVRVRVSECTYTCFTQPIRRAVTQQSISKTQIASDRHACAERINAGRKSAARFVSVFLRPLRKRSEIEIRNHSFARTPFGYLMRGVSILCSTVYTVPRQRAHPGYRNVKRTTTSTARCALVIFACTSRITIAIKNRVHLGSRFYFSDTIEVSVPLSLSLSQSTHTCTHTYGLVYNHEHHISTEDVDRTCIAYHRRPFLAHHTLRTLSVRRSVVDLTHRPPDRTRLSIKRQCSSCVYIITYNYCARRGFFFCFVSALGQRSNDTASVVYYTEGWARYKIRYRIDQYINCTSLTDRI